MADLTEPPALVLAGGSGWSDEVDEAVAAVPAHLRLVRPGYLHFTDLPGYLGGALVVAFPSTGEGFGLPVLEAMACGAPVLTTHRTSLPEVGGDAVAYTEPDAAQHHAPRCARCWTTPARRSRWRGAGDARAAEFTWAASAEAHMVSLRARSSAGSRVTSPHDERLIREGPSSPAAATLEAILLVGGQGTRLRPLTVDTPKPLLPTAGVPFLAHQLAQAAACGHHPGRAGHLLPGRDVRRGVRRRLRGFGLELAYVQEDEPLGTGGAIRNAAARLRCGPDDPVVVLNGDILSGHDLVRPARHAREGRRRGHPAPGRGARPGPVRLRADRRRAAGSPRSWRRPRTR